MMGQCLPDEASAPFQFAHLEQALDYVFSSYERHFKSHQGKFDREVRHPDVAVAICRRRGLLPRAATTVLVSGSKGKGTASRLLAWNLSATGAKTGLLLSPEESSHLDRIRINNQPIGSSDFCRLLETLVPDIEQALHQAPAGFYFPPSAIFLMVALAWFAESALDYTVLEGGRGVAWDEIGQIPAQIGLITSVLPEHLTTLGPTLTDILLDKSALTRNCQMVCVTPAVFQLAQAHADSCCDWQRLQMAPALPGPSEYPFWYKEVAALAKQAFRLLKHDEQTWHNFATPSFAVMSWRGQTLVCDGAISPECIDADFIQQRGLQNGAAVIGLSSDKDSRGIVAALRRIGFTSFYAIQLTSAIGHVNSHWLHEHTDIITLGALDVVHPDLAELRRQLEKLTIQHDKLYIIGVQVFCRSIRNALGCAMLTPKETA